MKLQFTNGYYPDFSKISRILKFLSVKDNKSNVLYDEIVAAVGIPYRQVRSIISQMMGFGLVQAHGNILTNLGKIIANADPFFQKPESLWIIHYQVSSDPNLLVWNRIIHKVFPVHDAFTLDFVIEEYFTDLESRYSEETYKKKLPREIRAVLDSYVDSELSRLNILISHEKDSYQKSTPLELPILVFLYALINFRDCFYSGSTAINVENLHRDPNSPGVVFGLLEYDLRSFLSSLVNRDLIRLERFGNLDQVRFSDVRNQEKVLQLIYGSNHVN